MAKTKTAEKRSRLRYREVADTLLQDIGCGAYPVGRMLPTEIELCQTFGVSRYTVREALRRLEEMGLVSRRQGSGTVVKSREPERKYVQTLSNIGELLKYPADTSLAVVGRSEVVADKQLATQLGCKPRKRWVKMECIRSTKEGVPICLTNLYVNPKFADISDFIGQDSTPVFALIERHFNQPVAKVEIEMYADTISNEGADHLQVERNTPALVVVRRYSDPPNPYFEVSIIEHPAGRFTYTMELEQAWGTGNLFG